jgi:transposase
MGRLNQDQGQLFYSSCLDEVVPADHLARQIAAVLDLSWVHAELSPHYSRIGRPSIDPVLMIRMLLIDYVFAIRSERALCREVQVNLAYRWFCGFSIEDKIPTIRRSRVPVTNGFATAGFSGACSSGSSRRAWGQVWSAAKGSRSMRA